MGERGREKGRREESEGGKRGGEESGREREQGERWRRERRRLPSGSIWLTRSVTMLLSASTDPSEMSRKISQNDELHFRGDL